MNGKCAFIFLYDMGIYCNLVCIMVFNESRYGTGKIFCVVLLKNHGYRIALSILYPNLRL